MKRLLLSLLAAIFVFGSLCEANAQGTPTNLPTLSKIPEHWINQLVNADGTGNITIVDCTVTTYGCNNLGTKITSIVATTTDLSSDTIELSINNGTETAILATLSIPESSGVSTSVLPFNILQLGNIPGLMIDSDGNAVLFITASQKLLMNATSAVSSGKTLTVFTQGDVF